MPDAALRPCSGGCHALVKKGRCKDCSRKTEQVRGSAWQRHYDSEWMRFKGWVISEMVRLGIVPQCGARLPMAPATNDSLCAAERESDGLQVSLSGRLDLDHIVPFEGRDDPRRLDPANVQLLCHNKCHSLKTATKDGGFGRR